MTGLLTNFRSNFEFTSCYGMIAAGTNQTNATTIVARLNIFNTVPAGSGVKLTRQFNVPEVIIINSGTNALLVYPETGSLIYPGSINAAVSLGVGQSITLNPGDPNSGTFNIWYQQGAAGPTDVQWDLINGLSTPYLLRGTYDGAAWFTANGGVVGSGQSTATRQKNATVLNSLFSTALSQGKFIELEGNTYEVNTSTGVIVPAGNGFTLRGSPNGTIIKQFYNGGTGAPVLAIGDATGATNSYSLDIEGLWLQYGSAQTGLTNASVMQVNALAHSRLDFIGLGGVGLNPGYNNLYFGGGPCFSNVYSNFNCNQALQNQIYSAVNGTGNIFENIYLNNGGSGVFNPLAGNYVAFEGGITNEMTFIQLNCEWGACNRLMDIQNMIGLHFIDLHVEGIKFTGSGPVVFNTANSAIIWDTCDFVDIVAQPGNMSGSLCIMLDYNANSSTLQMNNMTFVNNFANQITSNILLFSPSGGTLGQDTSVVTINKGKFNDQTNFNNASYITNVQFDVHMPPTSSQFNCPLRFDEYSWGAWGSVVNKPVIYPIDATYTHYGQHKDATLIVDASITSFTLTLGATMGASGNQAPPVGTVVHVRRETGSAAGTLTVTNALGGAALTSNSSSGQDFFYQVATVTSSGATWATFTQVT